MEKLFKFTGWMLTIFGGLFVFFSILTLFDSKEDDRDATVGLIMIGALLGVPGGALLIRGKNAQRARELRERFVGFARTHDQFSVAEMAQKIGETELETERLVAEAVTRGELDVVFHRPDRTYLHRNRIRREFKVITKCGSCGAGLKNEVALEGEQLACPYCGSEVTS
ncbi:hypothetical protein L6R52_41285 [Myxococcota bacterium]|nr:hypothetical protein [Myxococcota bacterium]